MKVIDYLKFVKPIDYIILAMLLNDVSVTIIAKECKVSRYQVYKVRDRSKELLLMLGLLDISTK